MRAILTIIAALSASAAFAETTPPQGQPTVTTPAGTTAGLSQWIAAFRPRAIAMGISEQTLNAAFQGVQYNPDVIAKDRNQAEFTKTIWDYLDIATSDERVSSGQKALRENAALLEKIEATYGVDKEVIVAIWGLESAYGGFRGNYSLIEALANLSYEGRRAAFFEAELIGALKILQNGDVRPENMTSSWAGAMGHTQFMPSSYHKFAVDFTGDGKRDIWSDDPADALASTGAYLAAAGWTLHHNWGLEITLPDGFDYTQTGVQVKKPVADWQTLGVKTAQGAPLPDHGAASVLLPAGARGAAFLIFRNFNAIEAYNPADAYVIGVGHLADRIKGGPPIKAAWPREDRALKPDERVELQALLAAAGHYSDKVDGKIGPNTVAAVKLFQASRGLIPDGYPSLDILNRLR